MTNRSLRILAALLLVFGASGLTAYADFSSVVNEITVTVPFDFEVGGTTLGPGTYSIELGRSSPASGWGTLIRVRDKSGKIKASSFAVPLSPNQTRSGNGSHLEFRRSGSVMELAKVWTRGAGFELM